MSAKFDRVSSSVDASMLPFLLGKAFQEIQKEDLDKAEVLFMTKEETDSLIHFLLPIVLMLPGM